LLARKFPAEEDYLKMKNQDLALTLNTHRVCETNAVINVLKKVFEVVKRATEGKRQQFNVIHEKQNNDRKK
jgi:hypothetical protein